MEGKLRERLPLSLVYNPGGPFLPPQQDALEADYKRELKARHGISFTRLYVFTNMPLGRFRHALERTGRTGTVSDAARLGFQPGCTREGDVQEHVERGLGRKAL